MQYRIRKNYSTNPEMALQEILEDRGVKDIDSFINPSKACELNPYDLDNIEGGAAMLLKHLNSNSKILIVQDSDVDGITSASILWLYIKHSYPNAQLDFRVHEHKQHGLSDLTDWIEDQQFNLVIVPDAGSYDIEYHQRLNDIGIDCLILDHHEQLYDEEGNPVISTASNTIIINNQLSERYTNKSLCGAGVVYKFCEVLDDILNISQAYEYIDLVALGEIADVMDRTTSETNYLMLEGLKNIKNPGLKVLLEAQSFSLKEKAKPPYIGLTPIDIAFYIAPLLNAITRVGTLQDKLAAFYCFTDPEKPLPSTKRGAKNGDVELAAEQTARVGSNAKAKQNRIKEKALELIDFKIQKYDLLENNILLIKINDSDNIPQEMTGLVAMGVVAKYNKPCLIGRENDNGEVAGSIRSNNNFAGLPNLKEFLEESGYFNYVAGHNNAAGFSLNNNKIDSFLNYADETLNPKDFENCYLVDYALNAADDNKDLILSLAIHPEYFGNQIDEIKLIIKDIPLTNFMLMGTNKDSIKISYNGIDYVRFKDEEFIKKIMDARIKKLTIYGHPLLNVWQGRTTVQCVISDYELKDDDSKYEF